MQTTERMKNTILRISAVVFLAGMVTSCGLFKGHGERCPAYSKADNASGKEVHAQVQTTAEAVKG